VDAAHYLYFYRQNEEEETSRRKKGVKSLAYLSFHSLKKGTRVQGKYFRRWRNENNRAFLEERTL